MLQLAIHSG